MKNTEFFHQKSSEYKAKADQYRVKQNRLALIRLIIFIASATLICILANMRLLSYLLFAVPLSVAIFGFALSRYNKLKDLAAHFSRLQHINDQEILREENKLAAFPKGQKFLDRNHAYLADLDIFGTHSLFQLLNRTTTESGEERLASWLTASASEETIIKRQAAIKELTPKVDWRQDFQSAGMAFTNPESNRTALHNWSREPVQLLPKKRKYQAIAVFLGFLAIVSTFYFAQHLLDVLRLIAPFSILHAIPLGVSLAINGLVLKRLKKITLAISEQLHRSVAILNGYEALIRQVESTSFETAPLRRLKAAFKLDNFSAAVEIRKLRRILDVLMQRKSKDPVGGNAFYTILNQFFLLDIHWVLLTESWKNKNGHRFSEWANAISELEALCSLSGFAFSNPSYAFPELSDRSFDIHLETLGHPLIHPGKRVCNDFDLHGVGSVAIITGSNMAGKSTFLRTLGVNLVLAFAGAPCCISTGRVSRIQLFTSMRTQDNLEEGVSSFYAELRRIEQLLKLSETGQSQVFFLLDEIFKGTNSQDRYKGGISLISQLSKLHTFGLVSTHDLELARTASVHIPVQQYSFNSGIKDTALYFDYKLTPGLCRDFNASELMKKSGIKILPELERIE